MSDNEGGSILDKIKVINIAKDELAASTEQFKRELPSAIEYVKIMAKLRKEAYDAHVKEGFNEQQALELCKFIY